MNFGKTTSWTDFGVKCSVFLHNSGPHSKTSSQNCSPHLTTMYLGGLKTLKNNRITFKWGQNARNRQICEIGP